MLILLLACNSDSPVWALQQASVFPSDNGITGTQAWAFFAEGWTPDAGDDGYLCTRAQTIAGATTTVADCADCRVAYTLEVEELGTDCAGDIATAAAYAGPAIYAIAEVPEALADGDPHPGDSFGWYVAWGVGEELSALGWAYPEELDLTGEKGLPGWSADRVYTLYPALAWDIQ
ncbi:MAG: hypothetical protein FJ090_05305 [Deltaproteobacteria bacterium]|nr:hypothetical protein [Deltaproteobacteria bacterium]